MHKGSFTPFFVLVLMLMSVSCQKNDSKPALVSAITQAPPVDLHQGIEAAEIPSGIGHKATVIEVLDAGQYTYIRVDENGSKLWIATLAVTVQAGDVIEFADAPAFANFESKILKRTFDTLIFAAGIRNNGKTK